MFRTYLDAVRNGAISRDLDELDPADGLALLSASHFIAEWVAAGKGKPVTGTFGATVAHLEIRSPRTNTSGNPCLGICIETESSRLSDSPSFDTVISPYRCVETRHIPCAGMGQWSIQLQAHILWRNNTTSSCALGACSTRLSLTLLWTEPPLGASPTMAT